MFSNISKVSFELVPTWLSHISIRSLAAAPQISQNLAEFWFEQWTTARIPVVDEISRIQFGIFCYSFPC